MPTRTFDDATGVDDYAWDFGTSRQYPAVKADLRVATASPLGTRLGDRAVRCPLRRRHPGQHSTPTPTPTPTTDADTGTDAYPHTLRTVPTPTLHTNAYSYRHVLRRSRRPRLRRHPYLRPRPLQSRLQRRFRQQIRLSHRRQHVPPTATAESATSATAADTPTPPVRIITVVVKATPAPTPETTPTPVVESGGGCNLSAGPMPLGAVVANLFLLAAPLGIIWGWRWRGRRK